MTLKPFLGLLQEKYIQANFVEEGMIVDLIIHDESR